MILLMHDHASQSLSSYDSSYMMVKLELLFRTGRSNTMLRSIIVASVALFLLVEVPGALSFRSSFAGSALRRSAALASRRGSSGSAVDASLCMKTIAVFGASGLTAQECVYQALRNGDSVVGLTR
jgi:hypothetical protein